MPELFHNLGKNVIASFRGRNLLWHLIAIILTILIVRSGLDWAYFCNFQGDIFSKLARPAILLGSLLPILGTVAILFIGTVSQRPRTVTTGWALGQAGLLGYLVSIAYKACTGRTPPAFRGYSVAALDSHSIIDNSHGFHFSFFNGGVFWGWPSSHTTVAFALSVCLTRLYPKNKLLSVLALGYAFYVGFAVSVSIHWLSEFVAGAIIGSVVGVVVGNSFRAKLDS